MEEVEEEKKDYIKKKKKAKVSAEFRACDGQKRSCCCVYLPRPWRS